MNSYPNILAAQFALVGGGEFHQPDVNSENGCYNPTAACTAGRLHFAYVNGSATIVPTAGDGGAALQAYTGDKAALNNFGVPGVTIGGATSAALSANPYYARIASNPGTSTLIGDAAAALADGGTFFSFWLGNNDVLGYATAGASAGGTLTSEGVFDAAYNGALNAMLAANADAKGVVANIPDVTTIPFFKTVPYNPIPLDAPTAAALTSQLANNYNAFLNGMVGATVITAAERDYRLLTFAAGQNAILINDETLTDLSPYMAGPYAGLLKYAKARQTKTTDLMTLTSRSLIGTYIDKNPAPAPDSVLGVTFPLHNPANPLKGDELTLIPSEITEIQAQTEIFNGIISDAVNANSTRLALVDAHTILNNIPASINGIGSTSSLQPPYGLFSADGIHPNGRGSAFMANQFIIAINAKFNANIPLVNPNDHPANDLPVAPEEYITL